MPSLPFPFGPAEYDPCTLRGLHYLLIFPVLCLKIRPKKRCHKCHKCTIRRSSLQSIDLARSQHSAFSMQIASVSSKKTVYQVYQVHHSGVFASIYRSNQGRGFASLYYQGRLQASGERYAPVAFRPGCFDGEAACAGNEELAGPGTRVWPGGENGIHSEVRAGRFCTVSS